MPSGGASPADARRATSRALGNVAYMREEARAVWISRWLETVWQDLRHAARGCRKQPLFAIGVVLVLALGVGSLSAAFAGLNAVLFRPWQVRDPGALVLIQARPGPNGESARVSLEELAYWRAHTRSLTGVTGSIHGGRQLGENGPRVQTNVVAPDFFGTLRVRMALGPGLDDISGRGGSAATLVISHRLWQTHFQQDAAIVGRHLQVGGRAFTIVGVAEAGFGDVQERRIDAWFPMEALGLLSQSGNAVRPDAAGSAGAVFGRLAPGVTASAARGELEALSRRYREPLSMPSYGLRLTDTRPINAMSDRLVRHAWQQFLPIFGGLGLVLLLTCSNVGSLLLTRALSRQREVSLRLTLGATRVRVVRQFFTEIFLLALAAGALGLLVATVGARLLAGDANRPEFYAPGGVVFPLTFVVCVLAATLAGGATFLHVSRSGLAAVAARRHGPDPRTTRLRGGLLAVQIAISTLLLSGGGLLARAAVHAEAIDPGFAVDNVQRVRVELPPSLAPDRRASFSTRFQNEVERQQIRDVAFANFLPLRRGASRYLRVRHGHEDLRAGRPLTHRPVSGAYFDVLDIAIVTGRIPRVESEGREIVVSAHASRLLWPEGGAVGRQLLTGSGNDDRAVLEVVGVAEDVPITRLGVVEPVIYSVLPGGDEVLVAHLSPDVLARLRATAATLEPGADLTAEPLRQSVVREGLSDTINGARLVRLVGAAALALSLIGAFGLFAYTVEERRREIGIRVALGGRAGQVTRAVLGTALKPSIVGVGLGFVASAGTATAFRSTVYGLHPFDPIAYVQVAGLLAGATALAALIPARRAARIDPAITLRAE